MPYLKTEDREVARAKPVRAGDLTYAIQQSLALFLRLRGESFATYAEMLGALDAAKLDLYTRKIQPYEERKCAENGDVW